MKRGVYKPNQILGPYGIVFLKTYPNTYYSVNRVRRNGTFQCHCGRIFHSRIVNVKSGRVKSCGCLWGSNNITHGLTGTPDYKRWLNIRTRCLNKYNPQYGDYGGRGITVYEPWINDAKLFIDYISKLPNYGQPGLTLDRIDNDGNYEPDNLRWATWEQQANNKRKKKSTILK